MKRNVIEAAAKVFLITCASLLIVAVAKDNAVAPIENSVAATTVSSEPMDISEPTTFTEVVEKEYPLTMDEIELIALVTMAEAEGEPELGKRLVIDTILNRVDHDRFPDTVSGVVYQPHQFEAMWNGRVDRCEVRDDIVQLVKEELDSRENCDVIFFRTDYFSKYGTPMFKIGNHCFSEY